MTEASIGSIVNRALMYQAFRDCLRRRQGEEEKEQEEEEERGRGCGCGFLALASCDADNIVSRDRIVRRERRGSAGTKDAAPISTFARFGVDATLNFTTLSLSLSLRERQAVPKCLFLNVDGRMNGRTADGCCLRGRKFREPFARISSLLTS